jgi:putative glutamine amidotransferase
MTNLPVRIAVPEPTANNPEYNQRSWPQYAHALESCGAIAVFLPLGESQAAIARVISSCAAILLPGSPADLNPQKYGQQAIPECAAPDSAREAVEELLLQDAFNLHKPIFGICYGLQSLNVWKNGTLIQHLNGKEVNHDPGPAVHEAHLVSVADGSTLGRILGHTRAVEHTDDHLQVAVNSSHHQAVDAPGDGLAVSARCPGDGLIEGLEGRNPEHFVLGVQWHPERSFSISPASRTLFQAFVSAARDWRPQPIQESMAR